MRFPRRRGWAKAFGTGLLLATIAYIFSTFDLFGLEKDSEKFSADFAQYVASPFYARGLGDRPAVGQQKVSVVYLDEAGLESLFELDPWKGYPPSYLAQAQLLGDVAAGAGADPDGRARKPPKAIFIDFTFLSKGRATTLPNGEKVTEFETFRRTISDLTHAARWNAIPACVNDEIVKIACIRAAGGIPVIVGGAKTAPTKPSTDAKRDLLGAGAMASVAVEDRSYPLLSTEEGADSPAALLLVADCLDQPRGCRPDGAFRDLKQAASALVGKGQADRGAEAAEAGVLIRKALHGRFAVTWSSRQAQGDPGTGRPGASDLHTALYGKASPCAGAVAVEHPRLYAWSDAAHRLGSKLTRWRVTQSPEPLSSTETPTQALPCPYALSLSYGDFVTGPPLPDNLRKQVFSDKLVLIGGQYANSNDWVGSPVLGQAAGVQYHAMALDNLLEARARSESVPRIDEGAGRFARLAAAVLILILVFVGGVHRIRRNDLHARIKAEGELGTFRAGRRFALLYLGFLAWDAVLVVILIGGAILMRIPINWFAIGAVALGHGLFSVRDVVGKDLRPIFKDWAPIRALRWLNQRLSLEDEVLHRLRPPKTKTAPPGVPPPEGAPAATPKEAVS
jgi:hypothetical protein